MKVLTILLTAMLIFPASATAPKDAEITFYSNGSVLASNTPYANHAAFLGWLFDDNQRIALIQPKHYVTLHVSPGPHVFSASFSKHPAKNSQLSLDLTEGGKYFVRVQAEWRGILVLETRKGRLDLVDCQIALQETAKATPTDPERILAELRDRIVSGTTSLPTCE